MNWSFRSCSVEHLENLLPLSQSETLFSATSGQTRRHWVTHLRFPSVHQISSSAWNQIRAPLMRSSFHYAFKKIILWPRKWCLGGVPLLGLMKSQTDPCRMERGQTWRMEVEGGKMETCRDADKKRKKQKSNLKVCLSPVHIKNISVHMETKCSFKQQNIWKSQWIIID